MAWVTPVTSWTSVPGVSYTDFNRIEGNILVLRNASGIQITDAGNYYTSTDVEGALQELYNITK